MTFNDYLLYKRTQRQV